jgi:sulfide:quinone oxidoreductase
MEDVGMKVLVLGAGFGGLELSARLSEQLGDEVDVTLIDRSEGFVFGFSKLDVMFARTTPGAVLHRYRDVVKPGVAFVTADILSIDPEERSVETSAGPFMADVMVIALGADVDPAATPGLLEGGHEFYTEAGAFALRDVLAAFDGGKVVVGVCSTPFKCPPAPSETALLVHDLLVQKGVRERSEVSLVMPLPVPIPPSPPASEAMLAAFAERDITFRGQTLVRGLDPERKVALTQHDEEIPFDLFLGIPKHHVPAVVAESGLAEDGWVPVDSLTLETRFPDVYAVGDVTSVGTPKAGVFAEGHAALVADRIIAQVRGHEAPTYDGVGVCYLEVGGGQVAGVEVTFLQGQPPVGTFQGASEELAATKGEFGSSRAKRWFGKEWTSH